MNNLDDFSVMLNELFDLKWRVPAPGLEYTRLMLSFHDWKEREEGIYMQNK